MNVTRNELIYITYQLHGEPDHYFQGEPQWTCNCGEGCFHIMPENPNYKNGFKCWSCDASGDVFDLIRMAKPRLGYEKEKILVRKLLKDFEKAAGKPSADSDSGHSPSENADADYVAPWASADLVVEDLDAFLKTQPIGLASHPEMYGIFLNVLKICFRHGWINHEYGDRLMFTLATRAAESDPMLESIKAQLAMKGLPQIKEFGVIKAN